jgi:hypothetical protein
MSRYTFVIFLVMICQLVQAMVTFFLSSYNSSILRTFGQK